MKKMIKAVLAPTHTNTLKALLDEPFTCTFHHTTPQREVEFFKLSIVNMLAVGVEVEVKIGQGFVGRRG